MNPFTVQRMCAWSGMVGITLFVLGFLLSGFIPPLSPMMTPEEVVRHYQEHATGIRVGMVLVMISGMFVTVFVGVISAQIRRMHNVTSALTYAQISAGTANCMFFFIPAVLFLITAYRPERSPEITYMLNDLCWIMAVIPWAPAFMQNVVIGVATLCDKRPRPVFPRWVSFMNFWVALGFIPGGLLPFFKHGPLAWSGLLVFWLAGSIFVIWFVAMLVVVLRAITQEEQEALASTAA